MDFIIGEFDGHIASDHWSAASTCNDAPFTLLGVNAMQYCKDIVGYDPESGLFPCLRNERDIIKVCKQLHSDIVRTKFLKKEITIGKHKGTLDADGDKELFYWTGPISEIEGEIGRTKGSLQREILGYEMGGHFPWCKSIPDLMKFCKGLEDLLVGKEVVPKIESTFTFVTDRAITGKLRENGKGKFFWGNNTGSNDAPFVGINKTDLQEITLGYSNYGDFPYCKSMADLLKFCKAIQSSLDSAKKVSPTTGKDSWPAHAIMGIDPGISWETDPMTIVNHMSVFDTKTKKKKGGLVSPRIIKVTVI